MVMPKALYLSNANELGLTYTLDELKEISNICKKLGLYFFIDGARLPIALAAMPYNLADIANLCDMFYLGGTKNGLPFGELVIIINDELKANFKYLIKNKLGMLAKGFVGAIMFKKYLLKDYYLELANNNLKMANIIRNRLDKYIIYPNNTNQIFIKLNKKIVEELDKYVEFEIWQKLDDDIVIRLVTSCSTALSEIDELVKKFDELGL